MVSNVVAHCFLPRGWPQVGLQSTFHGPLVYALEGHVYPIFTRFRMPTAEEVEAGMGSRHERSFYRNSFSMVSDSRSPALWRDTCESLVDDDTDPLGSSRTPLHIKLSFISS